MPARKRFIFNATAVAVGANFGQGHSLTDSWASCALPVIGGRARSEAKNVSNSVLSFKSAKTEITGWVTDQKEAVWKAETSVTGLTILNKLKAEEVALSVSFTFDWSSEKLTKVEVSGKVYTGLLIDGNSYDNVTLEAGLADEAGKNHTKFRQDLPSLRPGKHHVHKRKAFTYLGDNDPRLTSNDAEHAYLDVAGFGRVYFAEWGVEEDWQSVVGLRVVLDTPDAKGEIVIADPIGNGEYYP